MDYVISQKNLQYMIFDKKMTENVMNENPENWQCVFVLLFLGFC